MAALWGVKNHVGEVLQDFTATSRIEVGRKLVPTRYDAFRLQVSQSYRELFNRAVSRILDQKHWQIVRVDHRLRNFSPTAQVKYFRDAKAKRAPRGGSKAPARHWGSVALSGGRRKGPAARKLTRAYSGGSGRTAGRAEN